MKQELNLRSIYSFVLGLLLALFIGIGINTFLPSNDMASYSTVISVLLMTAVVIMVSIGLYLGSSMEIIANGLLLGSFFTLIYSVVVSFSNDDKIIRFAVISAAVVIILVVGYIKFIRENGGESTLPPQPPIS